MFMSMKHALVGFVAPVALVGLGGCFVSAHAQKTIRVGSPDTVVNSRPVLRSEAVMIAQPGTILEVIGTEGDWRWVLLPPDANGTRHSGWLLIKNDAHEAAVQQEPAAGDSAPSDKRAEKNAERKQKREQRRVEKAKRDLDRAREEYEKISNRSDGSATPANTDGSTPTK